MKAIVYDKYGPLDNLDLKDIDKPTSKDNEVLVKVYAASVNFNILVFVKGKPFLARFETGFLKPKFNIPGNDISGRVEAAGINVKQFQQGRRYGTPRAFAVLIIRACCDYSIPLLL